MQRVFPLLVLALSLTAAPAAADEPIAWDEAAKHVGERKTVEGRVVDVHCSPLACLLAFEPSFNGFTAVIQAARFERFPPERVQREYPGQRVRVTGTIKTIDSKPEIIVDDPAALVVLKDEPDPRAEHERTARAQGELVDRLDEMIGRMEEMTDRLAAIQERLEGILTVLAARESEPAAPPPPATGLVPPAPRAGFEAIRTVKRGMTPAEVERLAGQPEQVERAGNGWTTWYYPYGRSVTFDQRGRARSLVGFTP
jgi:hypothetical protein